VFTVDSPSNLDGVYGFSWVTVLLPKLERNDIWEQIVQPPMVGNNEKAVEIPVLGNLICPSDRDVASQPDLAGLSYSANAGGWDPRESTGPLGQLDLDPGKGDSADNGVFFDLAAYERAGARGPKMRLSGIKDGSGTTIMYAENLHKSYVDPQSPAGPPLFSWLFGTEQQLGVVWVAKELPQPDGNITDGTDTSGITNQERINGNVEDFIHFNPNKPRFARPASAHSAGAHVVFCDGHAMFLRDDIDYKVYWALMTPNGRKAVNPDNHSDTGADMTAFRTAAPLSEGDYQ
jgi:prepilin-type processing-associated H-X9-DG protein